jgi:GNAT superfamily N-acetyltransferase
MPAKSATGDLSKALIIRPANQASWKDLETVLGERGYHAGCWCQRWKMSSPDWYYKAVSVEERKRMLHAQTRVGQKRARTSSGLIAYLDKEPVGWCSVEPRSAYVRLGQAPWKGRKEDPANPTVWAAACFVTRAQFRRRGVSRALTKAAVDYARRQGARALEGYAMFTEPGKEITWGELHVGSRNSFAAAGLKEVHRPSKRRVVMRIVF